MTDQPADSYIKSQKVMCTCCQLPFKFTKKWNPEIMMKQAIKIYGETVKFEEGVNICKKCWDGLEKPEEE